MLQSEHRHLEGNEQIQSNCMILGQNHEYHLVYVMQEG